MLKPQLRFPGFTDDWQIKKLGDSANLTSSKRVYLSDYVPEGIPFYRGKEITELKQDIIPSEILYISTEAYNNYKNKFGVPKKNDLLITAVGTLGNVLRIKTNTPFYFKDGNLIWLKDVNESPSFLEILLDRNKNKLLQSAIGSSQKALTIVGLNKVKMALPTVLEQQQIADFLTTVDNKITTLDKKVELLKQYKKSVMQKIFTQQSRFKDENNGVYSDRKILKLGEAVEVSMGQSPESKAYNETGEGLYLIQGNADIKNRRTAPRIWTSETTKTCDVGDIILTVRAPSGYVAISDHKACIGRGVSVIRAKIGTDKNFIYQFLLWFEPRWIGIEQGSTFTAISGSDIRSVKLTMPSLEEQQEIAAFLTSIDEKITLEESKLKAANAWKKGLLQRMFV